MSESRRGSTRTFSRETQSSQQKKHTSRDDYNKRPKNRPFEEKKSNNGFDAQPLHAPSEKIPGAALALIELDHDIMKLLVKRTKLVSRIREGKDHASGSSAVMAEKAVRRAWEAGAIAFSKDPKFARQLFNLLQDIHVIPKHESQKDAYNLYPPRKPVEANVHGASSSLAAQLHICLAAAMGKALTLSSIASSDTLISCMKTCTQVGAALHYEFNSSGMGKVTVDAGNVLSTIDKTIFFGDGIFTLYFFSLMAVKNIGTTRLSGGGTAKEADLTPLRQLLPLLGARFTNLVPKSKGLPASIEASGNLPKAIVIPSDFPFEGVCAFLLAPLLWETTCSLILEEVPATVATAALAEVDAIFQALGSAVEVNGSTITYYPQKVTLSDTPEIPLDPIAASYVLSIPAFTGGTVTLKGKWPSHSSAAASAESILSWSGVTLSFDESGESITATCTGSSVPHENECSPFASARQTTLITAEMPEQLVPLALTLSAALVAKSPEKNKGTCLPANLLLEENGILPLASSMLLQIGMACTDMSIHCLEESSTPDGEKQVPWFCPDGYWGAAFALCSFIKPGLKLINPAEVSCVQPLFWSFFNGLPSPKDPMITEAKPLPPEGKSRRRIIAE